MSESSSPLAVSPRNVWGFKQNKPSLICRDLAELTNASERQVAQVLMARGVFKWFAVRRRLIKLKNVWRDEIRRLNDAIGTREIKRGTPEYWEAKGRLKALVECREAARTLCHSERWQFPDFDPKGKRLIEEGD